MREGSRLALEAGTRLGPYEILEPLGAGGMGEVYRARDTKLGRYVAIKVLPSELASDRERLRRFEQEARAASALNHPNIVTVHEIGEQDGAPYIVMEYVEGATLREVLVGGPLPHDKLTRYATQLAEGLAKAHEAGIVHRDLKPDNIVISEDGYVKILDFGLAKFTPSRVDSEMKTMDRVMTREGVFVGTVPYMSPEQAAGRSVDYRSDQFALGSVLYEMATAKRPFKRETAAQTLASIIEDEPEPVTLANPKVAATTARVIERCLSKDPAERYASTWDIAKDIHRKEVATPSPNASRTPLAAVGILAVVLVMIFGLFVSDLREWVAGEAPKIESIAVLPLENLSGDPEQEYFSDGLTEELIAKLAKIATLRVISRQSVMQFKDTDTSLPDIARALSVDALIEGSVRRSGSRVRITAQLVQANPERHLWAESYERDLRDILALQSEVAEAIVREIRITLTPEEEARLAHTRPVNPEAYEAFLLGRHHRAKFTPTDVRQAISYFQRAIELDPDFALAYSYLAQTLALARSYPSISPRDAMEQAKAAANKALEIDPQLSEAHAALGMTTSVFDWDWSVAERAFREAVALDPGSAETRRMFAMNLSMSGRHQEALAEMKRALDFDPLNLRLKSLYGLLFYVARQYDQAIRQLQTVIAVNPSLPQAHRFLGITYLEKEMYDEAIDELQEAVALGERNPLDLSLLGCAYVAAERTAGAKEILQELEQRAMAGPLIDSTATFHMHWMLGDMKEAFLWLERAIEERAAMVTWLKVTPLYDPLRSDPRFQDLLRRMNFPE